MNRIRVLMIAALLLVASVSAQAQSVAPPPAPAPSIAPAVVAAPSVPEIAEQPTVATPAPLAPPPPGTPAAAASAKKGQSAAALALTGPASDLQLQASLSQNLGLQTDADTTNAYLSLSLGGQYKLHKKIFLAAQITPYVEMTSMPGDNRRLDFIPSQSFVRLNFRNLLKDTDYTGISLGGNITYQLPISYNDLFSGNKRIGTISAALQLFKTFVITDDDSITLIGTLAASHPFFLSTQAKVQCDASTLSAGMSCPRNEYSGGYNPYLTANTGLTAIFNHGDFTILTAMSISETQTYGPSESQQTINGVLKTLESNNRFSGSFFGLVAYTINSHFSANVGYFNGGPQIKSREGYSNPFFERQFAGVFAGIDAQY